MASATDYYVDALFGSAGGDGSAANPWRTITAAMTSGLLVPGDVVHVAQGTYRESIGESFPIPMVSGVTLSGPGNLTALVRHDDAVGFRLDNPLSGTTVIEGLRFRNGGAQFVANTAILVSCDGPGGNVEVSGNHFDVPVAPGRAVHVHGLPDDLRVLNNDLVASDFGRDLVEVDHDQPGPKSVAISGNTITGRGSIEIDLSTSADVTYLELSDNVLIDAGRIDVDITDGARLADATISGNTLSAGTNHNFAGTIAVSLTGNGRLVDLEISGNTITDGGDVSLTAGSSAIFFNALVTGNTLSRGPLGVFPPELALTAVDDASVAGISIMANELKEGGALAVHLTDESQVSDIEVTGNILSGGENLIGGDLRFAICDDADATGVALKDNSLVGGTSSSGFVPGAGQLVVDVDDHPSVEALVSGNAITSSVGSGINLSFANDIAGETQFVDLDVHSNTVTAGDLYGLSVGMTLTQSNALADWDVTFGSNTITDNALDGIEGELFLSGGANIAILDVAFDNNTVSSNQSNGIEIGFFAGSSSSKVHAQLAMTGNTIASNAADGVQFSITADTLQDIAMYVDFALDYNTLRGNGANGADIFMESPDSDVLVELRADFQGNLIRNNVAPGLVIEYDYDAAILAQHDVLDVELQHNTITDNGSGLDLALTRAASNDPWNHVIVPAQKNWWRTTDPVEIEANVKHSVDDPTVGTVDFSAPYPNTLNISAAPFFITAAGGLSVRVNADGPSAFIPFVGAQPPVPFLSGEITGTIAGVPIDDFDVAEDRKTLTFTSPAGLPYGPTEIVIVNPTGQSGSCQVNINEVPVANPDSSATLINTPVNIDVAANDTDGNGNLDPTSATIETPPSNGSAVVEVDGTITYTPAAGFTGTDTLQYQIRDLDLALSLPATVTIDVDDGCETTVYCTAKVTSLGTTPEIGASGAPSLATNQFGITLANAVPNTTVDTIMSVHGPANHPLLGGTRCIAVPFIRVCTTQTDGSGSALCPIPIDASMVGTTQWFQLSFRDPGHPDGTQTGLSNGLEVTFCN